MINQNEKIIDYIAGIMKVGGSGIRGYEVLGAGKVITSENAMIITDKRILFITVPMPGAETIVAGFDIPAWQWLAAKKDIESKTKEMINSKSLEDILRSNSKNFYVGYNEIEKVKFGRFSRVIEIIKIDKKKLKYMIRDKNDFEKLKLIFQDSSK